jgi:hypothetical protein
MSDDEQKSNSNDSNPNLLVIQNFMRTFEGRRFILEYLQNCGIFDSMFNENPVRSAYCSGKRDAALDLERQIKEAAPGDYLKMIGDDLNE